jgi:hypothetical protein
LSPREHIANEGSKNGEEEDEHSKDPGPVSRRRIRGIEESPKDVKINEYEEEGSAVKMSIA